MSAYSDYKVTHDDADLATFRWECERDEREYLDSLYEDDDEQDTEAD